MRAVLFVGSSLSCGGRDRVPLVHMLCWFLSKVPSLHFGSTRRLRLLPHGGNDDTVRLPIERGMRRYSKAAECDDGDGNSVAFHPGTCGDTAGALRLQNAEQIVNKLVYPDLCTHKLPWRLRGNVL